MFLDIVVNISFVASIIFLFFSVAQLVKKEKALSNYFLSVVFLSIGIQCLSLWFYTRDSQIFYRYFLYSDSAFLFLIGAFLYLFFLYMTTDKRISGKAIILHTLPFFISLILIETLNLLYPDAGIKGNLAVFKYIITAAYLSFFIYIVFMFRLLLAFFRFRKSPEIKLLIVINLCSIVFSFLLILSNTAWSELQFICDAAFVFISLLFIFFLIRYPHYLDKVQKESQAIRYRKSQIERLNKQKIIKKLDYLIEHEKIYLDRSVSLKTLSDKLDMSSSQLSELLNSHYNTGFNSFINSYRIEEARTLLKNKSGINILDVAFECGFNSKTTFNTAFRRFTGLTPSEYKKKNSL